VSRLLVFILRLLHTLLPVRALGWLGEALGVALYLLVRGRRRIGEINLGLCFPELDARARAALLRAHFRAVGRATLQESVSWWGSRAEVEALTRIEGEEHLTPHLGKPMIWLVPHFVGLNIGGVRIVSQFSPVVSMYARIKNPVLDKLMLHARTRFGGVELYSRQEGIKPVIRAIRSGRPFYYLPDQDHGIKDGIFAPFFGVPAATVTGLSRIARATGAVVVPIIIRQQDGGYVARIYPAWEDFPSGDVEADTRRMNAFIEERVRELPAQYFWLHRRFKTRPPGEAKFYV